MPRTAEHLRHEAAARARARRGRDPEPPKPAPRVREYRCDGCGTVDVWGDGWMWLGTGDGPIEKIRCPACGPSPGWPVL